MRVKWSALRLFSTASIAALLAACGQKPPPSPPPTPEVGVFTVQRSSVPVTSELPGRTSAFLVAQVRSRVDGIVLRREFTEGAEVKAGQRLYKIDPAPYIAALNTAKATLAKAQANLVSQNAQIARYKILVAGNAISKQDYDNAVATQGQAAADVASGKALLDTAAINLSYTDVTSPVSGRTGLSQVTPGAYVQASQATLLTTVQQLDPAYVDMAQSSVDGLKLRRQIQEGRLQTSGANAAKVTLVLEDGRPYTETGKLQFSDVSVNTSTGSVTVRAIFPNKDRVLLPGMFVHATIDEGVNDKALIVPQIGVLHDAKGQAIALVVGPDNKVVRHVLVTSGTYGSNWVVESGLVPGDRVVVNGVDKAKPGTVVKTVPTTLPAPAASAPAATGPNNASGAQGTASAPAASGAK
ncbi:efflux RND transporter periplasmic adaptor subunit [Glaciimonas immobilis]|uniref:Membrane fusion protein (Multidrug efflux system) n=1 Tax=Glaciimonas immobilis TaxID=728004 RepID=A0A840RUM9_9BURK|nr:efflux RND transporter periplasmic adaptor subunit [Glaciimonas immobilis]KAF3999894.1 efflux RND transporter periplasmic adaptor subunit [Glaciimonas immobilis]MBB5200384.1 membrane fusion protein (multidrug efflux system) [Glaciimonas immobilis]